MAEEDDSQKTEEPSARKLSRLREEGQVPQSQEVKHWMILLGAAGGLLFLAPGIAASLRDVGMRFIGGAEKFQMDFENIRFATALAFKEVGIAISPLIGLMIILSILANVGQFGLLLSAKKIMPKLNKISPLSGFKRLFSSQSVAEFVKGLFKITIVGGLAFGLAIPALTDLELLPALQVVDALDRIHEIAILMAAATIGAMTVIAALDYAYQRAQFYKQQRQSKQEVKEELKQSEGDPQVKARLRQLRAQRHRQRLVEQVPKADVVVTNPTHFAVALEYKMDKMPAPVVVAKGMDHLAFRIRDLAESHEIPIVENPPLARALFASVEVDEEIPPEHFKAVAEVIGYIMRLKGDLK